jgi:hypothetical protein
MSKIIVYGNSDTRLLFGFPTEEGFIGIYILDFLPQQGLH